MPAAEFESLSLADVADLYDAWEAREKRKDYRAGVIAVQISNAHRDRKVMPQPFTLAHFFPSFVEERAPETPEEETARALAAFGLTEADFKE